MILHFRDANHREMRSGFALMEALISIVLVAMAMGAVMLTLSQAARSQRERLDRLLLTEFAYSKLEEWAAAGSSATEAIGNTESGWSWKISEERVRPNPPSPLDTSLGYQRVSIRVWKAETPEQGVDMSTVVARRLQ